MIKTFRPYQPNQLLLLPPDLQDWLAEDHLARFVSDVVDVLDLGEILDTYKELRGQPPHHPAMMVKLLLYAYCIGMPSSRRIEKATHEDVAFRVLACNTHPDHDSIADFRKRHLPALARLFVQVLAICQKSGLVKLGHVALDGTKIQANASKHKAMSYGRMGEAEARLKAEVEALFKEAETTDDAEDRRFGKGQKGDGLPEELARREGRLAKIREAKAALEWEARREAEAQAEHRKKQIAEREQRTKETGKKPGRRPPKVKDPATAMPKPKAQRNFTDPDSRIMLDGSSKGFIQGYNAQAAVDAEAWIIVASAVTQQASDVQQLIPMIEQVASNTGRMPEKVSADAGYFSGANLTSERLADIELFIPPGRQKHGEGVRALKDPLFVGTSVAGIGRAPPRWSPSGDRGFARLFTPRAILRQAPSQIF